MNNIEKKHQIVRRLKEYGIPFRRTDSYQRLEERLRNAQQVGFYQGPRDEERKEDLPDNIEDEDGFEDVRAARRKELLGPISRLFQAATRPATAAHTSRISGDDDSDDEPSRIEEIDSDEESDDEPPKRPSKKNDSFNIKGMATAALGSLASGAVSGIANSLFGGLTSVANTYIKEAKEGVRGKEQREDELKKLQLMAQLSASERRALEQEEERRAASRYAQRKKAQEEGIDYAKRRFQTRLELQKEYDKYLSQLQKENKDYYEARYAGARRRNRGAMKKIVDDDDYDFEEPAELPDEPDDDEGGEGPEAQFPSLEPKRYGRIKKKKNPKRVKPRRVGLGQGLGDEYVEY